MYRGKETKYNRVSSNNREEEMGNCNRKEKYGRRGRVRTGYEGKKKWWIVKWGKVGGEVRIQVRLRLGVEN